MDFNLNKSKGVRDSEKRHGISICVRLRDCWNVSMAGESWTWCYGRCGDHKVSVVEGSLSMGTWVMTMQGVAEMACRTTLLLERKNWEAGVLGGSSVLMSNLPNRDYVYCHLLG